MDELIFLRIKSYIHTDVDFNFLFFRYVLVYQNRDIVITVFKSAS